MATILALDKYGQPHRWMSIDDVMTAEAKNLVLNHLGEAVIVYRGGTNAQTGERSSIQTSTIVMIDGVASAKRYKEPTLTNTSLFARDRHVCAYCGEPHPTSALTRDHIHPVSKGGKDTWMNVVTACRSCNSLKGDLMPGQKLPGDLWSPQGTKVMDPLYVPYVPCKAESMILRHRNIKADQMAFLLEQITNKDKSRVYKDLKAKIEGGTYNVIDDTVVPVAAAPQKDTSRRRLAR